MSGLARRLNGLERLYQRPSGALTPQEVAALRAAAEEIACERGLPVDEVFQEVLALIQEGWQPTAEEMIP